MINYSKINDPCEKKVHGHIWCEHTWFCIGWIKCVRVIMRLIQNLTISWEINFYVKNTCYGKVITKKKYFWP